MRNLKGWFLGALLAYASVQLGLQFSESWLANNKGHVQEAILHALWCILSLLCIDCLVRWIDWGDRG